MFIAQATGYEYAPTSPGRQNSAQPTPRTPSPRQLRLLVEITEFWIHHDYAPTMQELADILQCAKVTVFEHIEALDRKGWLHRARGRARSIAIRPGIELPAKRPAPVPPVAKAVVL